MSTPKYKTRRKCFVHKISHLFGYKQYSFPERRTIKDGGVTVLQSNKQYYLTHSIILTTDKMLMANTCSKIMIMNNNTQRILLVTHRKSTSLNPVAKHIFFLDYTREHDYTMVTVVQHATPLAKVLCISSAPAFLSWPANSNVLPPLPMSLGLVRLLFG